MPGCFWLEQKEKHDTYMTEVASDGGNLSSLQHFFFVQKEGKEMRRKIETFEMLVKLIEENFMRERTLLLCRPALSHSEVSFGDSEVGMWQDGSAVDFQGDYPSQHLSDEEYGQDDSADSQ